MGNTPVTRQLYEADKYSCIDASFELKGIFTVKWGRLLSSLQASQVEHKIQNTESGLTPFSRV